MQSFAHWKNGGRRERAGDGCAQRAFLGVAPVGRAASQAAARACSSASSMSAHRCLTALELSDGPAELLAHLRVLRCGFDAPRRATGALRRDERQREVGDGFAVEVFEKGDRCRSGRVDIRDASRLVHARAGRDRALFGANHVPTAVSWNHEEVGERPAEDRCAGATELDCGGGGPIGKGGKQRGADLVIAQDIDRRRSEHGRQERAGSADAPELLQHDRQLRKSEAGTTDIFGEMEAEPPEVGELAPERRHRLRRAVEQRPWHGRRAVVGRPPPGRVVQRDVLVAQTEAHAFRRLTRRSTAPRSDSRRRRDGSCRQGRRAGR